MSTRFVALCARCGNHYDVDFEPALACHVGDDDWHLMTVRDNLSPRDLEDEIDDLVDEWHDGAWPDLELEQVIRARMSWSHEEFDTWVTHPQQALAPKS